MKTLESTESDLNRAKAQLEQLCDALYSFYNALPDVEKERFKRKLKNESSSVVVKNTVESAIKQKAKEIVEKHLIRNLKTN